MAGSRFRLFVGGARAYRRASVDPDDVRLSVHQKTPAAARRKLCDSHRRRDRRRGRGNQSDSRKHQPHRAGRNDREIYAQLVTDAGYNIYTEAKKFKAYLEEQ